MIGLFNSNLFDQVYNPLLTYQNEGEEIDTDGRRIQSSKSANKDENAPAENQPEETEEEKRDEKV